MIYERRIYYAMPGKFAVMNDRFASVLIPAWQKHGIRPVAFFEAVVGRSNAIEYLLAWESLAEREQKWAAFARDPEWRRAWDEGGPLLTHFENFILKPTSYSPLQ